MVRGIGGDPQVPARQGLLALEQGLRGRDRLLNGTRADEPPVGRQMALE